MFRAWRLIKFRGRMSLEILFQYGVGSVSNAFDENFHLSDSAFVKFDKLAHADSDDQILLVNCRILFEKLPGWLVKMI